MPVVDPFDETVETTKDGAVVYDPFDQPPPDFSKLGEFDAKNAREGQKCRLALGYLTTPNVKARADIIKKTLPGATLQTDPNNGRIIVSYKGETGYIDKPGITLGGVMDTVAQVGKFLPTAKIASAGANLATQVGRAAMVGGATSIAEDVASIPQGSEQGVDLPRAGITAAGAATGAVKDICIWAISFFEISTFTFGGYETYL